MALPARIAGRPPHIHHPSRRPVRLLVRGPHPDHPGVLLVGHPPPATPRALLAFDNRRPRFLVQRTGTAPRTVALPQQLRRLPPAGERLRRTPRLVDFG